MKDTKNRDTRQIGLSQRVLAEIKKLLVLINGKLFSCKCEDTFKSRQAGNMYAINANNKLIEKIEIYATNIKFIKHCCACQK